MNEKHCKQCHTLFIPSEDEIVFCSKKCRKALNKKRSDWVSRNREYVLQSARDKYYLHKEERAIKGKIWRENNKDLIRARSKICRQKNHEKISKKKLADKTYRLHHDPAYKLTDSLRHRVYILLKQNNLPKNYHYKDYIGCSPAQLKIHLEKQFKPGMTWDNHTQYGWHVDHIKPCAKFDKSKKGWELECFNYKNLQPLWWHENIAKGDKY